MGRGGPRTRGEARRGQGRNVRLGQRAALPGDVSSMYPRACPTVVV
uniref:Uncharacterized protein n=1 Tax=Arundo donax TaxID=35708 RepID=A0A0A8YI33_ARUDO